LVTLKMKIKNL